MGLSFITSCNTTEAITWPMYSCELYPGNVDSRMITNRLCRYQNGSLAIIQKTPAEVAGERILRPILNVSYQLSIHTFRVLKNGFSYFDNIFNSLTFLTYAEAAEIPNHNSDMGEISVETPKYNCAPLRALQSAIEKSKSQSQALPSSHFVSLPDSHSTSVVTQDRSQAQAYIEARMGLISVSKSRCFSEEFLDLIKGKKNPDFSEKQELLQAYTFLKASADSDSLFLCREKIIELLDEIEKEAKSFSLNTLNPLPYVLEGLLRYSREGYTPADLNLLVSKTSHVAKQMIKIHQKTNEKEAFVHWVNIIIETAEKDSGLIEETFDAIIQAMNTKAGELITWEQTKQLRKMAKRYQKSLTSKENSLFANKLLQMTESENVVIRFIFSYLENMSDDIRRFDESFKDIGSAVASSQSAQLIVLPPIAYFALNKGMRIANYVKNFFLHRRVF